MAYGDITPVGTIPSGTTANGALEFDTTQGKTPVMAQVDSTHVLVCWSGSGDDGFAQVMLDNGSGSWSTVGTALEFDVVRGGRQGDLIQVDSNHFLHVYSGEANDGFAVVLEVNLSTFAVTAAASAFEFDTVAFEAGSVCQLDSTHYLVAYRGNAADGYATVLEVNTGTWAVTEASGSKLEWLDASTITRTQLLPISSSRALLVYQNGVALVCQTLAVDTGTWAVTTTGSSVDLAVSAPIAATPSACWLDGSTSHALVVWQESGDTYFRVVTVDGSWNVSAAAAATVDTTLTAAFPAVCHVGADVYLVVAAGATLPSDANPATYGTTLEVEGDYTITQLAAWTTLASATQVTPELPPYLLQIGSSRVAAVYQAAGDDGYMQSYTVALTAPQTVTVGAVISDPAAVQEPTLDFGTFVLPDVITAPATVGQPIVQSGQTITPAVITAAASVQTPIIGALFIFPPTIYSDGILQEPPLIESPDNVLTPSLSVGTYIFPDAIADPAVVAAPQVNQTTTAPAITASSTVYQPTVIPEQIITIEVLTAPATVSAVIVQGEILPATISAGENVRNPTVQTTGNITIASEIADPAVLYTPTVSTPLVSDIFVGWGVPAGIT